MGYAPRAKVACGAFADSSFVLAGKRTLRTQRGLRPFCRLCGSGVV